MNQEAKEKKEKFQKIILSIITELIEPKKICVIVLANGRYVGIKTTEKDEEKLLKDGLFNNIKKTIVDISNKIYGKGTVTINLRGTF
ncbi:hypothetical protein KKG18_03545 [Patescibacteria group bacterium]|nr:hypothetical protein [Patescibacteria group bacterium]